MNGIQAGRFYTTNKAPVPAIPMFRFKTLIHHVPFAVGEDPRGELAFLKRPPPGVQNMIELRRGRTCKGTDGHSNYVLEHVIVETGPQLRPPEGGSRVEKAVRT